MALVPPQTGDGGGLASALMASPTAPTAPVVTTAGVAKSFGATSVLSDITVDVPAGITGLLGSNGAGKTTLLSMIQIGRAHV